MHKGFLIGSVVVFLLSLGCTGVAVILAVQGVFGMGSPGLWGAVAFHVATALVAMVLLDCAVRAKREARKEETP